METRKIMVVLPAQGGSRTLGENVITALTRLGHRVPVFDCGRYKEALSRMVSGDPGLIIDLYNQSLVVRALEEKADAVLVIALAPITPFTIQMLHNAGIRTLHYFCEDLRAEEHWKPVITAYDHFFVIQKEPWLSECRKLNANTHYLPNGAPVECMSLPDSPKETDLVFVGAPYANRIRFFDRLARTPLDFQIWGWGWDKFPLSPELAKKVRSGTRWIQQDELFTLYGRARIVLNLHSTLTGEEIEPAGDFVNPRAFTVPLCHSLPFSDRREALFEFFAEDREIVCFRSLQELLQKAQYFLSHPDHAAAIIDAAHKRVETEHLLTHRMQQLLDTVFPGEAKESFGSRVDRIRDRLSKGGAPASDDDLLYLLADDVLTRRGSEEEA